MRYGRLFPLLVIVLLALPAGAELGLALCASPSQCPMMDAMKAAGAPMSCGETGFEEAGDLPDCCRAEAPTDELPPVPAITSGGPTFELGGASTLIRVALFEAPVFSDAFQTRGAIPILGVPLRTLLQTFLL